jgi:hypothetical protein
MHTSHGYDASVVPAGVRLSSVQRPLALQMGRASEQEYSLIMKRLVFAS